MRVGVLGATGRMGRTVCTAVLGRRPGAGRRGRPRDRGRPALANWSPARPRGCWSARETCRLPGRRGRGGGRLLRAEATAAAVAELLPEGVHLVSGTTGLSAGLAWTAWPPWPARPASATPSGRCFALGAVLGHAYRGRGGPLYPAAEVIELHHQGKADAPSGTALRTARAIAASRGGRGTAGTIPSWQAAPSR